MTEHGYPPHLTPEPWGPLKIWHRILRAFWNWQDAIYIGVIVVLVVYGWGDLVKAVSWWFA